MRTNNPASVPEVPVAERKRIPMSLPMQKLEVPEIPGYWLYWMRGTSERLAQADRAGFEFVTDNEVSINNTSLGGDAAKTGNTDLGTRVTCVAGSDIGGDGQPVRLVLMKQKMEWHLEDMKVSEGRNAGIAEALTSSFRQGTVGGRAEGETPDDLGARYVNQRVSKIPDLFRAKK